MEFRFDQMFHYNVVMKVRMRDILNVHPDGIWPRAA